MTFYNAMFIERRLYLAPCYNSIRNTNFFNDSTRKVLYGSNNERKDKKRSCIF